MLASFEMCLKLDVKRRWPRFEGDTLDLSRIDWLEGSTRTTLGKMGKTKGHVAIRSLDHHVISSSWKYGLATCYLGHISMVEGTNHYLWPKFYVKEQDDEYLTIHFACRSLTFPSHVTSLFWSLLIVSCSPRSINFGTLSFLGALASWYQL
jgi:hypothetical protein